MIFFFCVRQGDIKIARTCQEFPKFTNDLPDAEYTGMSVLSLIGFSDHLFMAQSSRPQIRTVGDRERRLWGLLKPSSSPEDMEK